MKILCVCKEGNSRSVQFAHLLKYWGNDCISIGTHNTTEKTLLQLFKWADKVLIFEESSKKLYVDTIFLNTADTYSEFLESGKIIEFFLPDEFPRPFNKELHEIAKKFLEENKSIFKNK